MRDYLRELKWGTRKKRANSVSLPEEVYEKKHSNISWLIEDLEPFEKKIISLYYEGGYTLKEIGAEIGVKESWVSQLLSTTRNKIRIQHAA